MSEAALTLATLVGINVLLAWGVYVVFLTGQISLGQAAFMALGAYSSGVLTVKFGVPLVPALLAGGLFAAVFGVLVGFPALRVRGIYLAMVTLGVGEAVRVFFQNFEYTGGTAGFPGPSGTTLPLVLAADALALALLWRLSRTRLGWALEAVRGDEVAAASLGLNVTYLKVLAFVLGGFITAVAGGLYAHFLLFVRPEHFGFLQSVTIVLFVVLGGAQTLWGPLLGAVLLTLLPELARGLEAWRFFAFGALLVLLMAVRPQGLLTRDLLVRLSGLAPRVAAARRRDGAGDQVRHALD